MQIETQDIGNEQAKMLEEAKTGNAPDCAAVDLFVLGQFKLNHVLSDLTPYFSKDEVARSLSVLSAKGSAARTARFTHGGGIPI